MNFFLHCKPNIFYVWFIVCIPFCCFLRCVFLEHQKKTQQSWNAAKKCNVPWWLSGSPWNSFIVNIWTCLFTENFYSDKYCVNLKRLNNYILLFICSLTIMISLRAQVRIDPHFPTQTLPILHHWQFSEGKVQCYIMSGDQHTLQEGVCHVFWAMTSTTGDIRCKTLTSRWPGVPSKNTLIDNDVAPEW